MVILLNWVNSSGEYLLDRTLVVAAKDAAAHGGVSSQTFIGAFKADYYFWYNAIGVALAAVRGVAHPPRRGRALGAAGACRCSRSARTAARRSSRCSAVMRVVKIGENSLQYSLQDTTRHALFLVTSRAEKFVGKTAVDTIAVRIGRDHLRA